MRLTAILVFHFLLVASACVSAFAGISSGPESAQAAARACLRSG